MNIFIDIGVVFFISWFSVTLVSRVWSGRNRLLLVLVALGLSAADIPLFRNRYQFSKSLHFVHNCWVGQDWVRAMTPLCTAGVPAHKGPSAKLPASAAEANDTLVAAGER